MSPQVVMLDGKVRLNCEAPRYKASECMVYRDAIQVAQTPCSHRITGERLMLWEPVSLFNEISVTCEYKREMGLHSIG
uniref:Uncharacterized protein n=1 Tax=Anguilla anguilla TaxID=7936 RepID=A0A0E9UMU8_ANGAN